ncbi:MAG: Lin1244/Lin1753 domain-containing protein [Candidatus Magnetobacterium sp. LHC-1]
MKKSLYFPHDYSARNDPKLERLFMSLGYEGIGIYWCLIERLYEQGGYLNIKDIDIYGKGDQVLCERIAKVVRDFELFTIDGDKFFSTSCLNRLSKLVEKSEKATLSALKRWENANAMPTQCEGNAINKEINKEINKDVETFFDYFTLKTKKRFRLTDANKELIRTRLKDGYTIEQLKKAVDNFIQDDWPERKDHMDLIYCIGKQKGKPDNLEKWLNYKPKEAIRYV